METKSTTIAARAAALKPKHWGLIGLAVLLLLIFFGSGGSSVEPDSWTCENIKDDIIEMSQEEDLEVLEIGDVLDESDEPYGTLRCRATAEWSRGDGPIEYGAHVSNGGSVILQYRQQ